MPKRIIALIIFIVLMFICAAFSPWQYWNISLAGLVGVEKPEEFARLQVTSLEGEVEIFVDGESRGSVGPEGSPFVIEDIKPGQRLIKLVRVTESQGVYIGFERLIDFYPDLDIVIAYELGVSDEFSQGHFISAFKNVANGDTTRLNVTTQPDGVSLVLDGKKIGNTPVQNYELDVKSIHKLKLEKKGYESQEISLLPEDEEQRQGLKGFDINVEATMFLIPIRIEE